MGHPATPGTWLALAVAVGLLRGPHAVAAEPDPAAARYGRPSLVTVPPTPTPPRVDGIITAREWEHASALTGFLDYSTGDILSRSPVLFLTRDATSIYALLLVPLPADGRLQAHERRRDGSVHRDDSVEIYLRADTDAVSQIVVNAIGTVADYRDGDSAWNADIVAVAGRLSPADAPPDWALPPTGCWLVEIALAFSCLSPSPPAAGDVWSANVAANRGKPWAVLAPTIGGSYCQPEHFVHLSFADSRAPCVQVTSLGEVSNGHVRLNGRALNPAETPVDLRLSMDLRKAGSTLTADAYRNVVGIIKPADTTVRVPPRTRVPLSLEATVTDARIDRMALAVTRLDTGTDVLSHTGPVRIRPPLTMQLRTLPSIHAAIVFLDATGMGEQGAGTRLTVDLQVLDGTGRVLHTEQAPLPTGCSEVRVDCSDMPHGTYRCRAVARRPSGEQAAACESEFSSLPPPTWLTDTTYDTYGDVDRVPKPWTPIACEGRRVNVWGREMTWDDGLLPSRVTSQGVELLAAPIRVTLTVDDKTHDIGLDSFTVGSHGRKRVELVATGAAAGVSMQADMWVEYDGFLWINLTPRDTVPDRRIDALRVHVALPTRRTTLYQTFSRPLTGWIGEETIRLPWLARARENIVNFYHWFGNEDHGLGFTFASLQHWTPESAENMCTLRPGREATTYTINLAETPVSLGGRHYAFGLQATPIKPLPPDYHCMMGATLQHASWKAWWRTPENIDMALAWPHPQTKIMMGLNAPYHVDTEALEREAQRAHDKGLAFVGVAACPQKISPLSDDFEAYRLEWQTLPESVLNWHGTPHYQNCGRSYALRKWLFYGWAVENVRRLGLQGIYYDGWQTGQIACSNPHHGCGWTDESGKRHLTVPVLEGREFNQRMILFLEDNVDPTYATPAAAPPRPGFPAYHYWIHSWTFVPSVMGFATEWLTGEFTGYPLKGTSTLKPAGTFGSCMGLGLLRSRGLSTNWGVPNMFLPLMWEHTKDHATDRQTLMAYAWFLPHGVPIADPKYMNQNTVVEITRILLDFGARRAVFTPCWRQNPHLEIANGADENVFAATWHHPDRGALLVVVSNLDVKEARMATLRWQGFTGPTIENARSGEAVGIEQGLTRVRLAPESFVLLHATR